MSEALRKEQAPREPDAYAVLGVPRSADDAARKRAYWKGAKQFHPDNVETGNEDAFKEIVQAYELLGDPEKRTAYDEGRVTFWGHPRPQAVPVMRTQDRSAFSEEVHKAQEEAELLEETVRLHREYLEARARTSFKPTEGTGLAAQEQGCRELFAYFIRMTDVVEGLDRRTDEYGTRARISALREEVATDMAIFAGRAARFTQALATRNFVRALDFVESVIRSAKPASLQARFRAASIQDLFVQSLSESLLTIEAASLDDVRSVLKERDTGPTRFASLYAALSEATVRRIDTSA